MSDLRVHPDVTRARTLPSEFYTDPAHLAASVERILAPSWQLIPPDVVPAGPGECHPFTLLPGTLNEPLALTRDEDGRLRCLANACTHRAALVVRSACRTARLRCPYHGRTFGLDGRLLSAPGFEDAPDFPAETDHLTSLPLATWGPLHFVCLRPTARRPTWLAPLASRAAGLAERDHVPDAEAGRDYQVAAHWALYCENYLEGLHLPFVHPGLTATMEWSAYSYELFPSASLQVATAREGDPTFDLPRDHVDADRRIAAYHWFLFPNLMLNYYPWGLSVNLVEPVAPDRTRVRFWSLVTDARLRARGSGAALHDVELEDEAVVEDVQRGIRSRLYRSGRYSPAHERAVHHFHSLLAAAISKPPAAR